MLDPDSAEAYSNKGIILLYKVVSSKLLRKLDEAIKLFDFKKNKPEYQWSIFE